MACSASREAEAGRVSASRAGGHAPRTGERVARKSASRACFCVTDSRAHRVVLFKFLQQTLCGRCEGAAAWAPLPLSLSLHLEVLLELLRSRERGAMGMGSGGGTRPGKKIGVWGMVVVGFFWVHGGEHPAALRPPTAPPQCVSAPALSVAARRRAFNAAVCVAASAPLLPPPPPHRHRSGIYGNEAMLMAGPPLYVFIMLGVVPFVYSLPIALIVRAHRCGSHSLMQSTCCPRVHLALVCVCVSRGVGGGERRGPAAPACAS